MAKRKNNQLWKSIAIEDSTLNDQGLIAIEECTNYDLLHFTKNNRKGVKRSSNDTSTKPSTKSVVSDKGIPLNVSKSVKKKRKLVKTKAKIVPDADSEEEPDKLIESGDTVEGFETWSKFGLPNSIIKALTCEGFKEPTMIQSLTLPAAVLGGKDIVGAAETGSGKTLAFCLPILCGILREKSKSNKLDETNKPLYALILTPTRELAVQINNHLAAVSKFVDVRTAVIVGGMAAVKQERILGKGPEIVIATPGRLWELIQQGNPHLTQISDIKFLAIDETDRMLEKGHFEELHSLLERINADKTKSTKRQNFVFSATLSLVHDLPKYLLKKKKKASKMDSKHKLQKIINILGLTNAKIVDITNGGETPKALMESRICCAIDEKDYYIYYFLQKHPGRTIIFCNSIGCVRRLSNLLKILDCPTLPLHASMQQRQRLKNLERFTEDERGILVATDVAARGLDIPNIQHVLHYQTPRTTESYIHRSGRTARATNQGITVLLIEPNELQIYMKLCKTLNRTDSLPMFPIQDDFLQAVKQRVNLARQLDKLEFGIQKTNSEEGWLQKAARDMDIIIDDFSSKDENSSCGSQKKLVNLKRKQLSSLLAKPIFPQGFSGKYPQFSVANNPEETALELVKNVQKSSKAFKRKNK